MIKAGMAMGTAMPPLLAASGGLRWMAKGCSKEEGVMLGSKTAAEVSIAVILVSCAVCGVGAALLKLCCWHLVVTGSSNCWCLVVRRRFQ